MEPIEILGLKFPVQDYGKAIETFSEWIATGSAHHVCIANVHTMVMAHKEPEFRRLNDRADMLTIDGQPLRWYANLVCKAGILERVCGPELMLRCIEKGQEEGWRHYFYGGRLDVLDKLVENLSAKYPKAEIVGAYSPPFRQLSDEEDDRIVEQINNVKPDFLWVGLGAPKQEKWIAEHLDKLNSPVQVGVGAAFDFHAGEIRRAPDFLQKMGLEWLFRAWNDPRLWKRYLTTNPVFLGLLCRDIFRKRILGISVN